MNPSLSLRPGNFLGAMLLVLWYGWGLWKQVILFTDRYQALRLGPGIDAVVALQLLAQITSLLFGAFLILLLLLRDAPKAEARGFIPYAAAWCGTFASASFFFLSPAILPAPFFAVATLCIVIGLSFSIYTLLYLGKSFAILPSARTLVTDGPYRLVRHPLYLFEEIALLGVAIQYAQPWSLLIVVLHLGIQLTRMRYEEQILTNVFPEYASYAKNTTRFIPGIY